MHDVLVVGGGPVGSHLAFKLVKLGYSVLVLEKKKQLGEPVCCAGIISQECASTFAIDGSVVLKQLNCARLFSPSGKQIKLQREAAQACIVDRGQFNAVIANRAQAAGAEYTLGCRVRDIKVGDEGVTVAAACDGKEINFEARVAVIAAGYGSKLPENLGLGQVGDFVIGAQAEVETSGADEIEVYMGQAIAPGFFAWLAPISPSKALVGLLSRRSAGYHLQQLLSSLKAQGKIDSAGSISYRGISLRPPDKTYGRRLIILGDAAGQVKPTTGGGIYYGLLCAEIAADKLNRALEKDDLSARSLAAYERGWKKKLGWELNIGYWARKFYERLSDRQIDRIFGIIKDNGIDRALLEADDVSFDWQGKAILRIAGQSVLTRAFAALKIPLRLVSG